MTPEEILEGALREIDERGWARKEPMNHDGAVCIRGAICLTLYGNISKDFGEYQLVERARDSSAFKALQRIVAVLPEEWVDNCWASFPSGIVTDWNDKVARDAADVREVLKRAIDG